MKDLNLRPRLIGNRLKLTLLLLLFFSVIGCTTLSQQKRLKEQKDREIAVLKNLLKEKEQQIMEKDRKIERLRKQLEGFGVFSSE